ncbi:MAG: hypothetical protein WA441_00630 [Methyloceanibacter sp.]
MASCRFTPHARALTPPRPCRSCSISAPTTRSRLADPLYIGWKRERVRGTDYDDFVEGF